MTQLLQPVLDPEAYVFLVDQMQGTDSTTREQIRSLWIMQHRSDTSAVMAATSIRAMLRQNQEDPKFNPKWLA